MIVRFWHWRYASTGGCIALEVLIRCVHVQGRHHDCPVCASSSLDTSPFLCIMVQDDRAGDDRVGRPGSTKHRSKMLEATEEQQTNMYILQRSCAAEEKAPDSR